MVSRSICVESLESRRMLSAVLKVGPNQPYKEPSQAIAAAHDGDTITIDTSGNYYNDVALIARNNLTIEGVGTGRALIKTDGRVYGNKGIWVFQEGYSNLTIKNLDFEGATVAQSLGWNGAGLRSQGTNLTVTNCKFAYNQDGILGGYGRTTITHSEFSHNGLGQPGYTHNVYIGDTAGTLVFEYNYSHDSQSGHLLKSRAAINWIMYNRLSDEAGNGSYELDLPNGGRSYVIGNIIQQSAASQNPIMLAYGEEGIVSAKSSLSVVSNTFINDKSGGTFISAKSLPTGFKLIARNNIFASLNGGTAAGTAISMSSGTPVVGGNLATTIAAAKFVNAAGYDFDLLSTSPAINIGVAAGTDAAGYSLTPISEYVFATSSKPRPVHGKLDAGAYEF